MIHYAGIGSRQTPDYVCQYMLDMSRFLDKQGWHLRSGGADQADSAFEYGSTNKTIYLPFSPFNGRRANGKDYIIPEPNFELARLFHPNFGKLSEPAKLLISRNSYQVLGDNLDSPAKVILCWTPLGEIRGGTGQALRMAKYYKIPVVNFWNLSSVVTWVQTEFGTDQFDYMLKK